jgi:hypothetical protein
MKWGKQNPFKGHKEAFNCRCESTSTTISESEEQNYNDRLAEDGVKKLIERTTDFGLSSRNFISFAKRNL